MGRVLPKTGVVFMTALLSMTTAAFHSPIAFAQEETLPFSSETILTWDETGAPTSGMITFDVNTTIIKPFNTENVGGGTWTYGSTYTSDGGKTCYSKYMHRTKSHSATAVMGSLTKSVTARPGSWASATVSGPARSGQCNAYWSTL